MRIVQVEAKEHGGMVTIGFTAQDVAALAIGSKNDRVEATSLLISLLDGVMKTLAINEVNARANVIPFHAS